MLVAWSFGLTRLPSLEVLSASSPKILSALKIIWPHTGLKWQFLIYEGDLQKFGWN